MVADSDARRSLPLFDDGGREPRLSGPREVNENDCSICDQDLGEIRVG
jgi:hypothetical protein